MARIALGRRLTDTKEYKAWKNLRSRCYNPNFTDYFRYGGKGITVCPEWRHSFLAFLRDMGPCPPGHSIDRIDNDRGYEPGNCRWATVAVQGINRRCVRQLTYNGETLPMIEWTRRLGLPKHLLYHRIVLHGWDIERAMTTPILSNLAARGLARRGRRYGRRHGFEAHQDIPKWARFLGATVILAMQKET